VSPPTYAAALICSDTYYPVSGADTGNCE